MPVDEMHYNFRYKTALKVKMNHKKNQAKSNVNTRQNRAVCEQIKEIGRSLFAAPDQAAFNYSLHSGRQLHFNTELEELPVKTVCLSQQ